MFIIRTNITMKNVRPSAQVGFQYEFMDGFMRHRLLLRKGNSFTTISVRVSVNIMAAPGGTGMYDESRDVARHGDQRRAERDGQYERESELTMATGIVSSNQQDDSHDADRRRGRSSRRSAPPSRRRSRGSECPGCGRSRGRRPCIGRSHGSAPAMNSVRTPRSAPRRRVRVTVTMLPNRYAEIARRVAGRRLMKSAPTAMPTDQMMPMAESSRMRPCRPIRCPAPSTAKIIAPAIGSVPR